MPRNGSGTYVAPNSSWNPPVDGQTALSADFAGLLSDLSLAVSGSISADGQTATTGRIPFVNGISVSQGSAAAPALSFAIDLTTGLYQPATGQLGIAISGSNVLTLSSSALTLGSALAVTVQGSLSATGSAVVAGAGKTLGFYGAAGAAKPTITGAKGGNAALGSLITQLAALGLVTDGTSA